MGIWRFVCKAITSPVFTAGNDMPCLYRRKLPPTIKTLCAHMSFFNSLFSTSPDEMHDPMLLPGKKYWENSAMGVYAFWCTGIANLVFMWSNAMHKPMPEQRLAKIILQKTYCTLQAQFPLRRTKWKHTCVRMCVCVCEETLNCRMRVRARTCACRALASLHAVCLLVRLNICV